MKLHSGIIRKAMSILLTPVVCIMMVPFIFGNQYSVNAADTNVTDWASLREAAATGGTITITLMNDIVADGTIDISGVVIIKANSKATIYSNAGADKYDSMFKVKAGGKLTIDNGVTLSGKTSNGTSQTCADGNIYTADKFTGKVSEDGKTYDPKGFFIQVEGGDDQSTAGGTAILNGTISDFVTSRYKSTTPRYVAPVVAYGKDATFNIGETGVIKNNLVGYIVDDSKANNDAQSIKMYVKGAPPNVPRVPNIATQKANSGNYEGRARGANAGIDEGVPGSGITATAGAVIYKDGAKGSVQGTIENNRADTGGIMVSGKGTEVRVEGQDTSITKNVGVQFGGGTTAEQGGRILMTGGTMSKNVAWFGGGAVFATENGVDWLLGRIDKGDGVSPDFDARKDGEFFMEGGELTENTAFTRGGAILADSDGVNIQRGKLTYNMGRMLGGAMYVMGDHPKYEYTVQMTGLYVHDNASVSGEKKARDAVANKAPSNSTILSDKWKPGDADTLTWNHLDAPMDTLLQDPTPCRDAGDDILSGNVDGGKAKGNTDDWTDGTGAQGTGGGVWLCAYGNTIFDANKPDEVIITNNWATGAPGEPFRPGENSGYHKTLTGSDLADAKVNSASSAASRSGVAGGSDFHADTGGKGTVVINGLTRAYWMDENKNVKYESTVSNGRLNLINNSTNKMADDKLKVEVYGNLSRHGGGLAADGTYIFGTAGDQATPSASLKVEKKWANSVQKAPVTIRVIADTNTNKGKAVLADVPLDGEANAPETEFDTIEELAPTGNTWNGRFAFPMTADAEKGTAKLYTLVYTGEDIYINEGFTLTAGMELDPLDYRGKQGLGAALKDAETKGQKPAVKVLFGQPEYADEDSKPKIIKKNGDSYSVTPITIKFEEYKDNGEGNLIPCEDFIYTPGEIDFENIDYEITATPHYETTYEDGQIIETGTVLYNIYLFEIPLRAPMANDNWPITEKYVNKKVHEDIVNFDQDFEYDILAYVPETATEFTISDTLVKGLEFADKNGNPTTDPKEAVRAIKVKGANNHLPGEDGTVSDKGLHTNNGNEIDFIAWVPKWGEKYYPDMSIEDSTLSVTFDHSKPADNKVFGLNGANEKWVPGRWIQVTFGARIKDEYRSIEELKKLKAEVDGKNRSWEKDNTDKQAPDAKTITYANGDLGLVAALATAVGPDPVIWAVRGPSRLFARTSKGDYYATPMNDTRGDTWVLIDKNKEETDETGPFGSQTWTNADNRYNGRAPHTYDTKEVIDVEDNRLAKLKKNQKILGQELVKGAEGGSRLFVQTKDINGETKHIYTTPDEDKSGATWFEITEADGKVYENAIKRLTPDSGTIRMLDLETTTTTLNGDSENWPVISDETHEGMANQGKFNVKFGNGAKGTYKTNTVTVDPESLDLTVTKKWNAARKDEIPSPEDFKSFLVLKSVKKNNEGEIVEEKDISEDNLDKLTVTRNADGSYTAEWIGLPKLKSIEYSYEFNEKEMPGFTTDIDKDTNTITNTKTREEKPEIEKYVNQAVHKDITLDEVFTYDIIAYITKDADSVTITDKLNDVLRFESKAEEIKVVDLGENDNHLVTNNTSARRVNDNASVAEKGTEIDAAKATINGQTLNVHIANKMKLITEAYDPVKTAGINPYEEGYYEKKESYVKTQDQDIDSSKTYYTENAGEYSEVTTPNKDELDNYYELKTEYVLTPDDEVVTDKTYYEKTGDSYSEVTINPVNPSKKGYYEKDNDAYKPTEDTKVNPEKVYYERKEITDGSRGYEYDGKDQPVTALRGHWIKVTFKARIKDGLKIEDVKKAFAEIKHGQAEDRAEENKGNAPVVSAEDHLGIPNNASYTIGVFNGNGEIENAYGDKSNTVTVKPVDSSGEVFADDQKDDGLKPDNDEAKKDENRGADTGDNSLLLLFMLLLTLSGAVSGTIVFNRR